MDIGFIGLGRMGTNMVLHLLKEKHQVTVFDLNKKAVDDLAKKGAISTASPKELVSKLQGRKIIWLMVPAGKPVDELIGILAPLCKEGDIIIDGGNSFYKDSVRRYGELSKNGINYLDVGTSGGLAGALDGASLTIGGNKEIYAELEPLFKSLSSPSGYYYCGKSGAGHFVKMVHNGIEYALLESYGEGFEVIEKSEYKTDLAEIARVWNNGGVIRSWLLELAQKAFERADFEDISGEVGGGETGHWALKTAEEEKVEFPMLRMALEERKISQNSPRFSGKVVSAIRREFGGHAIVKEKQ